VARGLARNVEAYKRHLVACDQPRRNDLDGRGQLSEEALAAFAEFFLGICIDQVNFMESLVQPDRLRTPNPDVAEEEIRLGNLPAKSENILEAVSLPWELPRGDAAGVVNTGDRQARRISLSTFGARLCWLRRALVPRCGWSFLLNWLRGGCQDCFRTVVQA